MSFFQFQDPLVLLLLPILPLLIYLKRRMTPGAIHYSSIQPLKTAQASGASWFARLPQILRVLALVFLVLALARPQEGRKRTEILSTGVDIVLALDASGSMRALDFFKDENRVSRLEVVKDVVRDFVSQRGSDRLGMVAFGSEAFTQCPLTLDHDIFLSFLDKLKIGMAGDQTAIGSAIGIAVKRLKDLKSKSKVAILLTDGRNNAGNISPLKAAEIAKSLGVKVYTIGVGTQGKAPFLIDSVFGKRYVYQNVDLDEDTLKAIAETTGAKYFRATDRETLKDIYGQIDRLEKSEVKVKDHSQYTELFPWFVYPCLGFVFLEILLTNTRLRRFP